MIDIWASPEYEVTVVLTRRVDRPYVVTIASTDQQRWFEKCGDAVRFAEETYNQQEEQQ